MPIADNLFHALRGGGAGSWGIIVSATIKTFPTFNATQITTLLAATNNSVSGKLATLQARHWESVHASQYVSFVKEATVVRSAVVFGMATFMPNTTTSQNDDVGFNAVLGSRLIPAATYCESPEKVGKVYKKLLDRGTTFVVGKVAENANISSAIHPAWRTAKSHVSKLYRLRQSDQRPNAGTYSNEADGLEPDFQHTFFGPNYAKLSAIKWRYDPHDLFIVGAGVGSERWDKWRICRGWYIPIRSISQQNYGVQFLRTQSNYS
ncbi:hypothetical protein B0H13DRAFT_2556888 [Mycena leptocephala]|nr:hypothetical protein B0H13DRAFT_2556888 [Mycena leptocephala]